VKFWCTNGVWHDEAGRPLATVPMQPSQGFNGDLQIPQIVAAEGYKEYAEQHGRGQSFARLHERGGFCPSELCNLLFARIKRLEEEVKKLGGDPA
jgi:hypothetical protein